jgi:hypothetical protein
LLDGNYIGQSNALSSSISKKITESLSRGTARSSVLLVNQNTFLLLLFMDGFADKEHFLLINCLKSFLMIITLRDKNVAYLNREQRTDGDRRFNSRTDFYLTTPRNYSTAIFRNIM